MNHNNFYNKNLKGFARELRTQSVSKAEKYIWKSLLSRKQMGYKAQRQRPIEKFIVDFFIPELKLIVEVDGSSHFNKGNYDEYRQNRRKDLGFEIIRFQEGEVLNDISGVSHKLQYAIHCCEHHLP